MVDKALRASQTQRARKSEVFDKMTTVRSISTNAPALLKQAIAETISARAEGTGALAKLKEKLMASESKQKPGKNYGTRFSLRK